MDDFVTTWHVRVEACAIQRARTLRVRITHQLHISAQATHHWVDENGMKQSVQQETIKGPKITIDPVSRRATAPSVALVEIDRFFEQNGMTRRMCMERTELRLLCRAFDGTFHTKCLEIFARHREEAPVVIPDLRLLERMPAA